MDGLIFHNIFRFADIKTQVRMIKTIRELSGATIPQTFRLPIKFTMDNRYNVYFFENNMKFTIYGKYWQYHPQPITMSSRIYAEYIKNGGLNIIVEEGEAGKAGKASEAGEASVCLNLDTKKRWTNECHVLRTKYDIIVGIAEKI